MQHLDIAPNSTVNGANLDKITFSNVNNSIAFQEAYSKQLLQKPQQVQDPVQAPEQEQVEQGLVQKQVQETVVAQAQEPVVAQESRPSYQPDSSKPATFQQEISRIVQIAPRQNKATVAQVLLDIVDNSNVMDAKQPAVPRQCN